MKRISAVAYEWSRYDSRSQRDANGHFVQAAAGEPGVLVDPVPLNEGDEAHVRALGGVAAVVTSLLAGRSSGARGDAIVLGLAVFAGGVLVAGVAPSHLTAGLAYVGAGVGSALAATHAAALRQSRFPVRLQGRVAMAVRASIVAVLPVPLIADGWLADGAGPDVLLVTTASIGLAAAAWGAARHVPAVRS